MKTIFTSLLLLFLVSSCSKNINYSPEFIEQTSGRYIYNEDQVIDVFYENNELFIKWKAGKMKPVVLNENTFFVADMYKKLRFVKHPNTKERYLGIVSEDDDSNVEYAYKKVNNNFKTARMYLDDGEFSKAFEGYMKLREQDSTKKHISESELNRLGYKLIRDKELENAIIVFKINVALYPESDNVYDSLGEAYLKKGDSLQAFNSFNKSLDVNSTNKRAKEFVELYNKKHN